MNDDLTWHTRPVDAGQIIHEEYAADGDWLYCRSTDRSDGEVTYYRVAWDAVEVTGEFEPWNGRVGAIIDDEDWESFDPANYVVRTIVSDNGITYEVLADGTMRLVNFLEAGIELE